MTAGVHWIQGPTNRPCLLAVEQQPCTAADHPAATARLGLLPHRIIPPLTRQPSARAGVDENCEGRVVRAPGIRIGYLEQVGGGGG